MNTHQVLYLTYHEDEGNSCFVDTEKECNDFVAEQNSIGYQVLPLIGGELKMHNFELKFCEVCMSMTNHYLGKCQRCAKKKESEVNIDETSTYSDDLEYFRNSLIKASKIPYDRLGKFIPMEEMTLQEATKPTLEEEKEIDDAYLQFQKDAPAKFIALAPKFSWFITQYFGEEVLLECYELARKGDGNKLISILNDIWFRLPDGRFNIMENPTGWSEFLSIIEF